MMKSDDRTDELSENNKKILEKMVEMYKINFFFSCTKCVKEFAEARVHTITVGKRKLYWVRVYDVQKGVGVENIYDLVRKEICGIFETNKPTKEQKRKYKRHGKEWLNDDIYTYASSDLILKIIMYNKGSKKKGGEQKTSEFRRN